MSPDTANVLALILSTIAIGVNAWQLWRFKKRGW